MRKSKKRQDVENEDLSSSENEVKTLKRKHEAETPELSKKKKTEEERSTDNTIFVNNIPRDVTLEEFKTLFPETKHIRFPTKYDHTSKGYAFLVFDSEKKMEKCLKKKQGIEIKNKKLQLDMAGNSKTLYVKNINKNVTDDELTRIFPDCCNMRYPVYQDGKHKGYAYLQFESESKVKEIIRKKQGVYLKGEKLHLELAKEREQTHSGQKSRSAAEILKDGYTVSDVPTKSVTVRNLPFTLSEDDLGKEFGAVNVYLVKDPETGQSRGRAYLEFKGKRDAESAVNKYNEEKLHDRRVYLYYTRKKGSKKKEKANKNQSSEENRKNKKKQKLNESVEEDEDEEMFE